MKTCFFIVPKKSGPIAGQGFFALFRASLWNASSSSTMELNSDRIHKESKTAIEGLIIFPELSVAISVDPLFTVMRPGFVTFITRALGSGSNSSRLHGGFGPIVVRNAQFPRSIIRYFRCATVLSGSRRNPLMARAFAVHAR